MNAGIHGDWMEILGGEYGSLFSLEKAAFDNVLETSDQYHLMQAQKTIHSQRLLAQKCVIVWTSLPQIPSLPWTLLFSACHFEEQHQ